ncbi:NUD13 protein, partial [Atractosteus spatula]|nr:NUD13 protein [Atractosteus spatula]
MRWAAQILFRSRLLGWRPYSSYVSQMRYLLRLKEDDEACQRALQSGSFLLYHRLAPLLHKAEQGGYRAAVLQAADVKGILRKLDRDEQVLEESFLIGCSENRVAQFSLDVGGLEREAVEELCGGVFVDLKKAFFLLRGQDVSPVSRGHALIHWHQTHGYSSASGLPTKRNQAGSQRVCQTSRTTYYPQMAPVAIVLVTDGRQCLLARQPSFPRGLYSALAGFCDIGETVEETVRREVAEEVGLEVQSLNYAGSQHWPFPHSSLMVACHATVNPGSTQVSLRGAELEEARWFSVAEVREALSRGGPPRRGEGGNPSFWVPPPFAVANQLLQEWINQQAGL